jgi:hypothetical protein
VGNALIESQVFIMRAPCCFVAIKEASTIVACFSKCLQTSSHDNALMGSRITFMSQVQAGCFLGIIHGGRLWPLMFI